VPADIVALSQPTFGPEEIEALRAVLDSGWVAGQGPRGRELEERFADLCEVSSAVALGNCTEALHLAMVGFETGAGDEVLVADYTYPATAHAVLYTGANPVFVDVRPDLWTMDLDAAGAAVTERTVGIVAVDAFGQCADYDGLRELAEHHGLFLIEDAACSAGATYRGRQAGSLADVACFSLHARKGITSGEGGVLTTDDVEFAESARRRSCFGVASALSRDGADGLSIPTFADLGYNYKLSDVQAALALVQLDRLPALLAERQRVAARYRELLGGLDLVELPTEAEDRVHSWQSYVVTLAGGLDRGEVAVRLRASGVQCNIGTFACHRQPVYGDRDPCPVSSDLFDRHLAIPMHANLTDVDLERVAASLTTVIHEVAGSL
jgi:dTDP-4-amino-4,6-dideoxygalactose transaminase